ncbi:MAG TPA: hypothetical protein PLN52_16430 [Opitutaceae bacterium]|nr:hypothetical protein [Opitutaceae bacterium]
MSEIMGGAEVGNGGKILDNKKPDFGGKSGLADKVELFIAGRASRVTIVAKPLRANLRARLRPSL